MSYRPPQIFSGHNAASKLQELSGSVIAVTMEEPWKILRDHYQWSPERVHMIADMNLETVEALEPSLPPCDVVVGVGGGSAMDTAKFIASRRGCRMVLVPTIVSVDAPLTNTAAVRVDSTVQYVEDIYPEEVIVDHTIIQQAPKELNRAGACDIASIHTALYDWRLARDHNGEAYDESAAREAEQCLKELETAAQDIYDVTPKGIDTIIDLFRREVEFCARIGTSRPEEGSEHIVAYNLEHITGRHFLHGDLVGLGIFAMARLQENEPEWITELVKRIGLRYTVPDASPDEIEHCLRTLKLFKDKTGLFYSVVDEKAVTDDFVRETMTALGR